MEESPDGWVLSDKALQKVVKAVRQQLAAPLNPPPPKTGSAGFGGIAWHCFINESTGTIPSHAIMRLSADPEVITIGDDIVQVVYKCNQPSTVFTDRYAVNSAVPVEAAESGLCCFEGPVYIAYNSTTTPARGDGYGPKPGDWRLNKGFPRTTVVDVVVDSTNYILQGSLGLITTVIGKSTGAIPAATTTTNYRIYAGTQGSETDAGFSVPTAVCRTTIVTGKWLRIQSVNNGWEIEPLEC